MRKDHLHAVEIAAGAESDLSKRRNDARIELAINIIEALSNGASLKEVMEASHFEPTEEPTDWLPWNRKSPEQEFADWIGRGVSWAVRQLAEDSVH